jgi:uncharacterized protein YdaU (DUF1376 family)
LKRLPFFKWFPADAESDELYSSMDDQELGFFHRCLNKSWLNNGLPSEPTELCRVLKMTLPNFERVWRRVQKAFYEQDGRLYNRRQEQERTEAIHKSEQATDAARRRYGRYADAPADAPIRASESVSDSSSSLSSKEKKEENPEYTLPFEDSHAETSPDHPRVVRPAVQAATSEAADWFAQWWEIYWLHKARAGAETAFRKRVRTEPRFQRVMAATREQTPEMLSREPSKRPYGATWLNGERWEDEPSAPVNGTHPPTARPSSTDAVRALAIRNLERTGHLL